MESDAYVRPHAWLQHLKTKLDMKADFQYKAKLLEVASECLQGRAAAWWTALGERNRVLLLSDYTHGMWSQQMHVLCPSKEQLKQEARERKWDPSREACWDYVWDNDALFEELPDRDKPTGVALMAKILYGLPTDLDRMSRTESSRDPQVTDLMEELQVLVPRWEKENAMEATYRRSRRDNLIQATPKHTDRKQRSSADNRDPQDSLAKTYHKSKMEMRRDPTTKKLGRSYTKPNGKVIFLNRNCYKCEKGHYDFEHDSTEKPSAHFTIDEDGYEE